MKTNYLFPSGFRKAGWILAVPSAAALLYFLIDGKLFNLDLTGFFANVFGREAVKAENWSGTHFLAAVMAIFAVALLFIAFAKEKVEDEYIAKLRGDSLVWAVIVNYAILIIASICLYDITFLYFMCINMYTLLILFIIKFRIRLYKMRKTTGHEE